MSTTVYLVKEGIYEGTRVVAVFHELDRAATWVSLHSSMFQDLRVEEAPCDIDPLVDGPGYSYYEVELYTDRSFYAEKTTIRSWHEDLSDTFYVFARTEEEAGRVAWAKYDAQRQEDS